jgi:hypothetical protein
MRNLKLAPAKSKDKVQKIGDKWLEIKNIIMGNYKFYNIGYISGVKM